MAITFSDKKVLILGAGVTGVAVARALSKRGAKVSLVFHLPINLALQNLMHLLYLLDGSRITS